MDSHAQLTGDGMKHRRLVGRRQLAETDPVRKVTRDETGGLPSGSRLPHPADPGHRHQRATRKLTGQAFQVRRAAYELRGIRGQRRRA